MVMRDLHVLSFMSEAAPCSAVNRKPELPGRCVPKLELGNEEEDGRKKIVRVAPGVGAGGLRGGLSHPNPRRQTSKPKGKKVKG